MNIERVAIENPFSMKRDVRAVEIVEGSTLADYVRDYAREKCATLKLSDAELEEVERNLVTVYNGAVVPVEDRVFVLPKPDSQIVISPNIQGGNAGKSILRAVAMIGIAVLAMVTYGAALHAGWSLFAAASASASIAVGGALLINTIFPMPKLDTGAEESPTYGWSGPMMTSRQGIPLQRGYGKFTVGGNVINSYVQTVGDKQYLNVLISFGHGPAKSIDNIKINDNPLSNYTGVTVEKRLGHIEQTPISFFADIHADYPQNAKCVSGSAVTINGHRTDATVVEVELYYPKGVWRLSDDNKYKDYTVKGKVEYKKHTDSTWKNALAPRTTADADGHYWVALALDQNSEKPIIYDYDDDPGSHKHGEPYKVTSTGETIYDVNDSAGTGSVEKTGVWVLASDVQGTPQTVTNWTQKSFEFTGHDVKPRRQVVKIAGLAAGQYDVRVTKTSTEQNSTKYGDELWISSVRESAPDDLTHPGIILLGVRALATDRLSGGGLNVIADVTWAEPETIGYKHSVAHDKPSRYYRFGDADSGTTCLDSSGYGKHGTYPGAHAAQDSLIPGSVNGAVVMQGGAGVTMPSFTLQRYPGFAVECWVKVTDNPFCWILRASDLNNGLAIRGSGLLDYKVGGVDHNSSIVIPNDGNPHHVVFYNSGGTVRFIVDGVLDPQFYGGLDGFTATLMLVDYLGVADELAIYDYPMLWGRARAHYLQGIADNRLEDYTCDNPAMICWDIMTNPIYGGGISPSVMDIQAFKEWADYCNELVNDGSGGQIYRSTFGGIFDTPGNVWDAVGKVARLGRAVVVRTGLNYTVITDKQSSPVQLFTVGNMIRGSFREAWLSMSDRANSVDVTFFDMALGKPRTITVQDEDAINDGDQIRQAAAIDLFGCTSEAQAWREGKYLILANKYLRRAVSWESNVEAIACRVGQVVKVQHDLTEWGQGGKLVGGDTATLKLDREVTIDPAKQYRVLVVFPTYKVVEAPINSISGNRVYITGFVGSRYPNIKRAQVGTVDKRITDMGNWWIEVSDASEFQAGQTISLYEIDSLQSMDVTNDYEKVTTTDEIKVIAPFEDPVQFGFTYSFGEVNNEAKEFRVTSISKTGNELRYQITAAEYNPLVYQDLDPVVVGPAPIPYPQMVKDVRVTEIIDVDGSHIVSVGWRPGRTTFGVKLYRSDNDGPENIWETLFGKQSYVVNDIVPGQKIKIRVVGFDGRMKDAPFDDSPWDDLTVGAEAEPDPTNAPPGTVQNFRAVTNSNGTTTFYWTKNGEADLAGYEIRKGATASTPWSSATVTTTTPGPNDGQFTSTITSGYFFIKAKDNAGQYSNSAAMVYVNLSTIPADVQGFKATNNDGFSMLSWYPNTESNLSGYEIRKASNGTTAWASTTFVTLAASSATNFMVELSAYYYIKAKNSSGQYSTNAKVVKATPIVDTRYTGL